MERATRGRCGLVTRMSTPEERNAPAWGGGVGYSGGWRERSPNSRERSLDRSASNISLPPPAAAYSTGIRSGKRSLSPPSLRQRDANVPVQRAELGEGSPVYFFLEGFPGPRFGRIRFVEDDGSFTVDVVGGRRIVGLRQVVSCSAAEVEKAQKLKYGWVTRRDRAEDLSTRNRPSSRSPSPIPHLRGIPINFPPRSAIRMARDPNFDGKIRSETAM